MEEQKAIISPYCFPGLKKRDTTERYLKEIYVNSYKKNKYQILDLVAKHCCVNSKSIISNCRKREFTDARHIFCAVVRLKYNTTLKEIGEFLNNRDHTSIRHGIIKFRERYHHEENYRKICNSIFNLLNINYNGERIVDGN